MTLEDVLRRSVQMAQKKKSRKKPDTVKLRTIRTLVRDFEIREAEVAFATGMSPETVRRIAAGEGPYKDLIELGPERVRWVAEWMRDYVEQNPKASRVQIVAAVLKEGPFPAVPRLVKAA